MRNDSQRFIYLILALVFLVQGQTCAFAAAPDESVPTPQLQYTNTDYHGAPWVSRTSRPFTFKRGLDGRHLSVWASHGRYFDGEKKKWMWQRPFLYCTTEDMLTQSFVYPYLIPMLERAGAVVFTPRERDYQLNEAIVDNDTPSLYGSYAESGRWTSCAPGFSLNFQVLNDTIQPFTLGTSRTAAAGSGASALWMPQIPATGRYAVYVSYPTVPGSVSDAHYTVHHAGGTTTFNVNQQMGGGTWVYLGTFLFEAGQSERNSVTLSSESAYAGSTINGSPAVIGADCVRFGGGRSMAERSIPQSWNTYTTHNVLVDDGLTAPHDSIVNDTLTHYLYGKGVTSGFPRYLEAARYYAQWAGLEDSLYNRGCGSDDYKDDLRSRSYLINRLSGGSCYQPDTIGRGVPIELQFALHTDAGFHRDGRVYGSLTIATAYGDDGHTDYRTGLSREVSRGFADRILHDVAADLSRTYNVDWPQRELRVANYSETRSPQVPSTILELLAHQNYTDMVYAHDPNFKFVASRAIYKSLLRQVYHLHNLGDPVVQPLPVKALSVNFATEVTHGAMLTWTPQSDPLEPSATPTDYILYIRQGDNDWDEGTLTQGNTGALVVLQPGVHYQFRVSALNDGGESFPSEPVSAYLSPRSGARTLLLVNAFDRLSGPARVESKDSLGFDLNTDVGVSYGVNTSLCGPQTNFRRADMGKSGSQALGFCSSEYTGIALAGNNFDGIALHTNDIIAAANSQPAELPTYNIVSMSRDAFDLLNPESLGKYALIDYIAGLQADKPNNLYHYDVYSDATRLRLQKYAEQGGALFVSGSYVGQGDSTFVAQTLHCIYRATTKHYDRGTFNGLGIDIPVFNRPNDTHYPCQESQILEPVDDKAFSAFAYSERNNPVAGYSAGIAWNRGVVMAFPYDCISDSETRRAVMRGLLRYLIH